MNQNFYSRMGSIVLALSWMLVLLNYSRLPASVAMHFNAAGEANDFGPKATIWALPLLSTLVFLLLGFLSRNVNRFRQKSMGNNEAMQGPARSMLRHLQLSITVTFLLVILLIIKSAGKMKLPGEQVVLPLILVLVMTPMVVFFIRVFRRSGTHST